MKTSLYFLSWLMMLILSVGVLGVSAQQPFSLTGNESVCLNSTHNYGVIDTPTSTYSWAITTAGGGSITNTGHNMISVLWQTAGVYTLEATETNSSGCAIPLASIQVTVDQLSTITLTSAAGTVNQTVCTNNPITNITYATTGASGVTITGLPSGVTGTYASNGVTISGTASTSGTFSYTITLTGGCGNVTANGTITVTLANTISLTSAANTVNQTVCNNNPIINISYTTAGATGATFTGLPSGVTGSWASGEITIIGTPSASGNYNFTVTLTGGCGNVTSSGTIRVNPLPATSPIYHN